MSIEEYQDFTTVYANGFYNGEEKWKNKIRDMKRYREFELQQQYKDFENDSEWKTYNKILEEN